MSFSIDPSLSQLIAHQFPAVKPAGSFYPLSGLTGLSGKLQVGDVTLLARQQQESTPMPGIDRRREYHILRGLSDSGLAPVVQGYNRRWLLLHWQAGRTLTPDEFSQRLPDITARVSALHQQPLSGFRLLLLPLLEQYWLLSHASRRHLRWLNALRRCQRQGEPKPLRLALLHMDIHPGNIVTQTGDDLHLIDWEYASDGDVALELAAMIAGNDLCLAQQESLIADYAIRQQLDPAVLRQQIRRWAPWLRLLIACWYERRWQQSGDKLYDGLATEAWQQI